MTFPNRTKTVMIRHNNIHSRIWITGSGGMNHYYRDVELSTTSITCFRPPPPPAPPELLLEMYESKPVLTVIHLYLLNKTCTLHLVWADSLENTSETCYTRKFDPRTCATWQISSATLKLSTFWTEFGETSSPQSYVRLTQLSGWTSFTCNVAQVTSGTD